MSNLIELLQWGPDGWGDELAAGAFVTISLSLAILPVGLIIGFFLALAKQSRDPLMRLSAHIYTTLFRGIPELLTLFLVYYGAQYAISAVSRALIGTPLQISPFVAGMFALGFVLSSYASEVFLSAFRAIPRGQEEAAAALGLRYWQTMRIVVLPQLIRLALPGLSNLWLNVMKDTALVSVITLNDLLRETTIAVGSTKQPFVFYGVACLLYLLMSMAASVAVWRVGVWAGRGATR